MNGKCFDYLSRRHIRNLRLLMDDRKAVKKALHDMRLIDIQIAGMELYGLNPKEDFDRDKVERAILEDLYREQVVQVKRPDEECRTLRGWHKAVPWVLIASGLLFILGSMWEAYCAIAQR